MTLVGFYVVQASAAEDKLRVAVRLVDKAVQQGHRVFINAADESQARQLDDLLWSYRPASFLPHGLCGTEHSQKIAIGWGQEPGDHDDLLINLKLSVPEFFSRFRRVAEVVTQDTASLEVLRESWRFYKSRGYQLEKHDL